jgi:hypothetical protein
MHVFPCFSDVLRFKRKSPHAASGGHVTPA